MKSYVFEVRDRCHSETLLLRSFAPRLKRVFLVPLFLLATLFGQVSPAPNTSDLRSRRPLPEFSYSHGWLGTDDAYSIPLSAEKSVWLFGDTFVALSSANVRSESKMVRNTVAIQAGDDPRTASITFSWRKNMDGSPASFFPEHGQRWYWPGHGIRLAEGPVVIFLYVMVGTPGKNLGFACTRGTPSL